MKKSRTNSAEAWLRAAIAVLAVVGGAKTATAACLAPPGDIDQSGVTNVVDVQCAIVSALSALNPPYVAPLCTNGVNSAPDVDCNGAPSVVDVTLVIYYALGTPLSPAIDANNDKCVDNCQLVGCMETAACLAACDGDAGCKAVCEALAQPEGSGAAVALANCAAAAECLAGSAQSPDETCWLENCALEVVVCQWEGNTTQLNDCCAAGVGPGCDQAACLDCVCGQDGLCCTTLWDEACAAMAQPTGGCAGACQCPIGCDDAMLCGLDCAGDTGCMGQCVTNMASKAQTLGSKLLMCLQGAGCFGMTTLAEFEICRKQHCSAESAGCFAAAAPPSALCCDAHGGQGCSSGPCTNCVCTADPLCCFVAWDESCVGIAGAQCNLFCQCEPLACHDALVCWANCGGNTTCQNQCLGAASPEAVALAEPVLACAAASQCPMDGTAGELLQCIGAKCQNEILACQGKPPLELEPCCEVHDTAKCDGPSCQDCVCAKDATCCTLAWDEDCVGLAGSTCNDACGCKPASCLDTYVCMAACGGNSTCVAACGAKATPLAAAAATSLAGCAASCMASDPESLLTCAQTTCPNAYKACEGPAAPNSGGCCSPGTAPQCSDILCAACVCTADPLCCTVMWDGECAQQAVNECKTSCNCASLTCFQAAVCAGKCAGDLSCVTGCQAKVLPGAQGAITTLLDCLAANGCLAGTPSEYSACAAASCGTAIDACLATSLPPPSTCCEVQPGKGCAVAACQTCVCSVDPVCCTIQWDNQCAKIAGTTCKTPCGCDPPGPSCMEIVDCAAECTESGCAAACAAGAPLPIVGFANTYRNCLNEFCGGQPGAFGCALSTCPDALWSCLKL